MSSPPPTKGIQPFPQGVYNLIMEADLNSHVIIIVVHAAQGAAACCENSLQVDLIQRERGRWVTGKAS